MVEGERPGAVAGVGDDGPLGVVGAPGLAPGPGHEDGRDGVEARVPRGVRIGAELSEEIDLERGLFAGLPAGGRLERLAVLDEAAGQGPPGRRVAALDEDDAPAAAAPDLDDDVDGRDGIAELGAGHGDARSSGAIVVAAFGPCQCRKGGRPRPSAEGRQRPRFSCRSPRSGTLRGRRRGSTGGRLGTKTANINRCQMPGIGREP